MRDQSVWIVPDWPAPARVRAASTTRVGGYSAPPYRGWNLAGHVGDDHGAVGANRELLRRLLRLPAEPAWLRQVHGRGIVEAATGTDVEADGSYTRQAGVVCAVLTADCLPILLSDISGTGVAAVHAGWRGLAAGVIEAALEALRIPGEELLAWLGPAIGPASFRVGEAVREAFLAADPRHAADAFTPADDGYWCADLYRLARQRLTAQGVTRIHGGGLCTVRDAARFYSYRREGTTGRMATLIWLE
jgi:YfiH family protein